jgi:predicted nucleic acid-binding protein
VFSVRAANEESLVAAMGAVVEHGLSFWDAMIWATAEQAGCRLLISEDLQDGRVLGGVRFVDPFKEVNRTLIDTALPALPADPA